MMNVKKIVDAYNAQEGIAKIRDRKGDFMDKFLDMEFQHDITEDMILACIEHGDVTSRDTLFSAGFIKACYQKIKEEAEEFEDVVFEEPSEPVTVEPTKVEPFKEPHKFVRPQSSGNGAANAFTGVIEEMAYDVLEANVPKMLDEKFEEYLVKNPAKVKQTIEWVNAQTGKTLDEITHEKFKTIAVCTKLGIEMMLVGPAGTGKNHLCKQIAEFLGLEFYFANAVTQEYKLTGFIDANGTFHKTQFYDAFTKGGLFMFDEIDASDPEVMVTFNAALANGYMDFPTGREYAHEDFRVIAAANTTGNGASHEYVGRNQLDAATLDRFGMLRIDYDKNIEESLTDDMALVKFVRKFREACNKFGINHVVSYRAIRRCSMLKEALGIRDALEIGLIKNLERDDMQMMVNKFSDETDEWSVEFCKIANA